MQCSMGLRGQNTSLSFSSSSLIHFSLGTLFVLFVGKKNRDEEAPTQFSYKPSFTLSYIVMSGDQNLSKESRL